jgi:hypothetical protein
MNAARAERVHPHRAGQPTSEAIGTGRRLRTGRCRSYASPQTSSA